MRRWSLREIDTPNGARSPVVLHSQDGEARVVLINLDGGQALGEHQVREAAMLLVVDGSVTVESGGEAVEASAGELFHFDPNERRAVRTDGGGRVLLFLAPWPGAGHYGADRAAGAGVSAS